MYVSEQVMHHQASREMHCAQEFAVQVDMNLHLLVGIFLILKLSFSASNNMNGSRMTKDHHTLSWSLLVFTILH